MPLVWGSTAVRLGKLVEGNGSGSTVTWVGNLVDHNGWGSTGVWVGMLVHRKDAVVRPLPWWVTSLTTMAARGCPAGFGWESSLNEMSGLPPSTGWGISLTTMAGVPPGSEWGSFLREMAGGSTVTWAGNLVDFNGLGSIGVWVEVLFV